MERAMRKLKTPVAAAVLCLLSGAALAQSSVTLYGVVDEFFTYIKPEGQGAAKRLDSSGLLASRVGFRGREDLGAGLAANFTLEAGLNANDGSNADANRFFNRQSWVGLSGAWGEVRAGRQNTPQFYMNGEFDAFNGATQASGWNNVSGTAPRVDDAFGYFTPKFGNVSAQILIGRGSLGGAPVSAQTRANQNLHAAVEWKIPTTYVGMNYESIDNATLPYTQKRLGLAANYAVTDNWRIYGAYGHETRTDDSLRLNLYSLSARWQFAPTQNLAFGYFHVSDKLSGTGHGNADETSVLYRYLLSKRTTIYTALSHLQQHGLRTSFSLGGAAVVESGARPTTTVPGGSINAFQLGVTHTF
jgi:predicted porin